jgi:hypothetical protein
MSMNEHLLRTCLALTFVSASACFEKAHTARLDDQDDQPGEASLETDGHDENDDACRAAASAEEDFLAAHRSCARDADCAVAGHCSNADFKAVRLDSLDEASRLGEARGRACGVSLDGPVYEPGCVNQQCVLTSKLAAVCGEPSADGGVEPCAAAIEAERAFAAAHDECVVDADCKAVGTCSGGGFFTVSAAAESAAFELVQSRPDATCPGEPDAYVYKPVCRANHCVFGDVLLSRCGYPGEGSPDVDAGGLRGGSWLP